MTIHLNRTKNQECIMMEYYDPHDLWHFLSSHGLLFTGLRAISLGEKPGQSDLGHCIEAAM